MAGVIATVPKYQFSDSLGTPLAGGTLTTYIAGTTTLTNTWQDEALTTANTNPIVLDSRGECVLWLSSSVTYKLVLKNAVGVTQWTVDNVSGADHGLTDQVAALQAVTVTNIAALRASTSTLTSTVNVQGFTTAGDGGGGTFYYVASDTTTADNGGTIIVSANGRRWYRNYTGALNVLWFGLVADADPGTYVSAGGYGTTNAARLQSCIDAAWLNKTNRAGSAAGGYGGSVYIPSGYFQIAGSSSIILRPGVSLLGDGPYASVLCCTATYAPTTTRYNLTLPSGLLFIDAFAAPYSTVSGYPNTVENIAFLSLNGNTCGIYVNRPGGVFIDKCWVAGWANAGIVFNSYDHTLSNSIIELCTTCILIPPLINGIDIVNCVLSGSQTGLLVNNNPLRTAAGGTSGVTPTLTTTDASLVSLTNAFNGYFVQITAGPGAGQTGFVSASAWVTGTTTFTVTPTGGSWATAPTGASTFTIQYALSPNPTKVTNVQCLVMQQYGFNISQGRSISLVNCSADSADGTYFPNGGLTINQSADVQVVGFHSAGGFSAAASTRTSDGIFINQSDTISITDATVFGWRNGIVIGDSNFVTLSNVRSQQNRLRGVLLYGGTSYNITGGSFSNNGTTVGAWSAATTYQIGNVVTNGGVWYYCILGNLNQAPPNATYWSVYYPCGIQSTNSNAVAYSTHQINGALASNINGAQQYGIVASVTDNGANTGATIIGGDTVALSNATANYLLSGRVDTIFTANSLPISRGLQTVASAATISIPGNVLAAGGAVLVSGTTNITSIDATGTAGARVTLIFQGALTFTDGSNLKLAGNLVTTADDTITLVSDGTNWYEISRAVN